jgi:hypothetical protein
MVIRFPSLLLVDIGTDRRASPFVRSGDLVDWPMTAQWWIREAGLSHVLRPGPERRESGRGGDVGPTGYFTGAGRILLVPTRHQRSLARVIRFMSSLDHREAFQDQRFRGEGGTLQWGHPASSAPLDRSPSLMHKSEECSHFRSGI